MATETQPDSKEKLIQAALHVVRVKGYSSTTVDDVCREAGVTKGSFFHHFRSKDEMALAAVAYWNDMIEGFFAAAPYHELAGPVDRLFGYIDFRLSLLGGELADYTCFLGTLVQETYENHPEIRIACEAGLNAHIATLTRDVELAKSIYAPSADWSPASVGDLFQTVLQGAFILAKSRRSPDAVREGLDHLRRYLTFLFNKTP